MKKTKATPKPFVLLSRQVMDNELSVHADIRPIMVELLKILDSHANIMGDASVLEGLEIGFDDWLFMCRMTGMFSGFQVAIKSALWENAKRLAGLSVVDAEKVVMKDLRLDTKPSDATFPELWILRYAIVSAIEESSFYLGGDRSATTNVWYDYFMGEVLENIELDDTIRRANEPD